MEINFVGKQKPVVTQKKQGEGVCIPLRGSIPAGILCL